MRLKPSPHRGHLIVLDTSGSFAGSEGFTNLTEGKTYEYEEVPGLGEGWVRIYKTDKPHVSAVLDGQRVMILT